MSNATNSKGYFVISHYPDSEKPTDIGFTLVPDTQQRPPEDQYQLKSDIESFLVTLNDVYRSDSEDFKHYYQRAFYLAQLGLEGDKIDTALANRALEQHRSEIVVSAGANVRNKLLKEYGKRGTIWGAIIFLIAILLLKFPIPSIPELPYFLLMLAGSMIGSWLSLGVRTRSFGFEELRQHIRDESGPTIRLAFTSILSLAAGLLMHIGALNISIGSLDSSKITSDPLIALTFGVLLGFSEKALVTSLTEKTKKIIS